jgi:hypothetical protein
MPDRSQLAIRLALAVGALALLCVGAGVAALLLIPPVPRSHAEQVTYELGRRGVRYREVGLGEMWPDRTNLQYGTLAGPVSMTVMVRLESGASAGGWVECREPLRGCTLTLKTLGIDDAPLPDMVARRLPPWLRWIGARLPLLCLPCGGLGAAGPRNESVQILSGGASPLQTSPRIAGGIPSHRAVDNWYEPV